MKRFRHQVQSQARGGKFIKYNLPHYDVLPQMDWHKERSLKTYCEQCEDFDYFIGGCRFSLLPSECPKLISSMNKDGGLI